jgi:hypothetical protein
MLLTNTNRSNAKFMVTFWYSAAAQAGVLPAKYVEPQVAVSGNYGKFAKEVAEFYSHSLSNGADPVLICSDACEALSESQGVAALRPPGNRGKGAGQILGTPLSGSLPAPRGEREEPPLYRPIHGLPRRTGGPQNFVFRPEGKGFSEKACLFTIM